jgi:hypothetical protein
MRAQKASYENRLFQGFDDSLSSQAPTVVRFVAIGVIDLFGPAAFNPQER